jgi:hypothetical protein
MRFLFGALCGALLSTSALAYVFVSTTTVYRSTLFQGESVRIVRVKGSLPKVLQ